MTPVLPLIEPITRDGAREAAQNELSKTMYQDERPSLAQQLITKGLDLLDRGIHRAGDAVPGGAGGLAILAILLIVAVVVIRLRTGPMSRSARAGAAFGGFDDTQTPAEHRRLADRHEATGEYAEAIRERLRAIVRDLECRVIIEPRLGRTADEVAIDGGAALPDVAADLHRAARTFDDVWYGARPATADMAADLRAIDRRIQDARPAPPARQVAQVAQLAVPR